MLRRGDRKLSPAALIGWTMQPLGWSQRLPEYLKRRGMLEPSRPLGRSLGKSHSVRGKMTPHMNAAIPERKPATEEISGL
jgi:hypothetical protein